MGKFWSLSVFLYCIFCFRNIFGLETFTIHEKTTSILPTVGEFDSNYIHSIVENKIYI